MVSEEVVYFRVGKEHEQGMCHQTEVRSFEILVEKRGMHHIRSSDECRKQKKVESGIDTQPYDFIEPSSLSMTFPTETTKRSLIFAHVAFSPQRKMIPRWIF